MILGFLRSASRFLVEKPQPFGGQKEKGRESGDNADSDSDDDSEFSGQTNSSPGGTAIITLRNVQPYTECKYFLSHGKLH